jgi:hypothetical protein
MVTMTENESRLDLIEEMIDMLISQLPADAELPQRSKVLMQTYLTNREYAKRANAAPVQRGAWFK